jgi:hypothetical protein
MTDGQLACAIFAAPFVALSAIFTVAETIRLIRLTRP